MQERIIFYMDACDPCDLREHPQLIMRRIADQGGFKVIGATPQSICDQWWFWIEYDGEHPVLPPFLKPARWLPVGSA